MDIWKVLSVSFYSGLTFKECNAVNKTPIFMDVIKLMVISKNWNLSLMYKILII